MQRVTNPILPGFYPDPSIIRVADDSYVVNSSFEYFPAIPIWHSRDLVHWRQIGNVVSDQSQGLDLSDVNPSGGVQAATLRYHAGTYYVTSTRVKREWPRLDYHFIVTATDPHGPWSECHFIENAEGIDSSLFFDEDGSAYFLANRLKASALSDTDTEIWMSRIDLESFELTGDKVVLWDGTGGIYPEGPRLFKRNGWYYLLIAEGGTLHHHTTTFARSQSVWGPFEPSVRNPVLTHKHLAREYPIHNVGHADMVELADGSWWGVCLASRPRGGFYDGGNTKYSFGGYYRNLGRETFLFPIAWPADDVSPLFCADSGKLEFTYDVPLPPVVQADVPIDFSDESLLTKWVSIGERAMPVLGHDGTAVRLTLESSHAETFFGFRQTSWEFDFSVTADLSNLVAGDAFGVVAWIKPDAYLILEVTKRYELEVNIRAASGAQPTVTALVENDEVKIRLSGRDQDYTFSLPETDIQHTLDGREISCDMTDSHTGVMLGFVGTSEVSSAVRLRSVSYSTL